MPPPPPLPPPKPKGTTVPARAAQPTIYGRTFDAWNSSSTGHQRAEQQPGAGTAWRASRNRKLMGQYAGGSQHVSDTAGPGARHWDARAGAVVTPGMRARAKCSVADMLARPGAMRGREAEVLAAGTSVSASSVRPPLRARTPSSASDSPLLLPSRGRDEASLAANRRAEDGADADVDGGVAGRPRRIFDGVVVYVNGSTHPLISDHRLRHVLVAHGGSMSSHLGRRKVTHVILGRPATSGGLGKAGGGGGAGGGLAAGKLQREIVKTRGPGIKYVGVQVSFSFFFCSFSLHFDAFDASLFLPAC